MEATLLGRLSPVRVPALFGLDAEPVEGALGRSWGWMTGGPVPTVLAVDIFDTFNFTGARVPRFEDIRDEFPKELGSSVFFSADFFKPPESKGEALWTLRCPAVRGRGGGLRGSCEKEQNRS